MLHARSRVMYCVASDLQLQAYTVSCKYLKPCDYSSLKVYQRALENHKLYSLLREVHIVDQDLTVIESQAERRQHPGVHASRPVEQVEIQRKLQATIRASEKPKERLKYRLYDRKGARFRFDPYNF